PGAATPDGGVLNPAAPQNVTHATLSAARNDKTFYDLTKVNVHSRSSTPRVARVDAAGTVSPAGAGVANITATVSADGTTKSTSFPVVVYSGARTGDGVTLFEHLVQLGDRTVSVDDAARGVQLSASMVPAAADATYTTSGAYAETNTAQAAVTPDGVLTATRPGVVRVTVVADQAGQKYTRTATVTVTPMRQ